MKTPWNKKSDYVFTTDYNHNVLKARLLKSLVTKVAKHLIELNKTTPFDAIAACGFSGLPLIGALGYRLGVQIIAVRKKSDSSHSSYRVEGLVKGIRYVAIDDLVSTGTTLRNIISSVHKASGGTSTPVAVILYNDISSHIWTHRENGITVSVPCISFKMPHD